MNGHQYKYVPAWLARRYPVIASLEENPLALYLSGCGYGVRRWYSGGKARAPIASAPYYMLPMLILFASVFASVFCIGALFSPVVLVFFRYFMFEKWWRECGRDGKLMDWYLCMGPQEIVLGIAGGRLIGRTAGHAVAATVLSLPVCVLVYLGGLSSSGFDWPDIASLLLAASGVFCIYAMQFLVAMDSIYTTLEAIALSARRAAIPHVAARFSARFGDAINGWANGLLRVGTPLLLGILAGALLLGFLALANAISKAGIPVNALYGVALVAAASAVIGIYFFMLHARHLIPRAYLRAVYSVQDYLPAILDANPPAL
ncbi:MAG: hypothetical protein NTX50_29765 [Candidatus Sumerlaeota bacterium]|nr:hypothetical protein [Candidatus Sumerlaeota bacterium]